MSRNFSQCLYSKKKLSTIPDNIWTPLFLLIHWKKLNENLISLKKWSFKPTKKESSPWLATIWIYYKKYKISMKGTIKSTFSTNAMFTFRNKTAFFPKNIKLTSINSFKAMLNSFFRTLKNSRKSPNKLKFWKIQPSKENTLMK